MQHFCHTEIGVVHAYQGGVDRVFENKVAADEDGRRLPLIDVMGVLGVGKKGDAPFVYLLNAAGFPDESVLVAFDGAL